MGYGHISPEVKEQLINKVGSLFLATGESSRNLSKILLQDYNIKLSHVTVLNYIKLFAQYNACEAQIVASYIRENTEDTINDPEVYERVLEIAKRLKAGENIQQVSIELGISYWTAYRDINERLKRINESLYNEVKEALKRNSLSNISTHGSR